MVFNGFIGQSTLYKMKPFSFLYLHKKKKKKNFKAATDIYMYIITYFDRYLAKNKWLKFSL